MRAAAALVCAVLATAARAQDVPPETRAAVALSSPKGAWYAGEVIEVRADVAVDAAWFDANAVQLFRREVDVPVHVDAPWLDAPAGARAFATPEPSAGPRIAVNDRVVLATEGRPADPSRRVLSVTRRYVAESPGEIVVPAPKLRFAVADRFEQDAFGGRVAVGRRDVVVEGAPLRLTVKPLPEEGRPDTFRGAVGRFRLDGAWSAVDVRVGDPFRFTLRISGDGDVTAFEPPRLDGLAGVRVLGQLDDRASPVRTVVYELAALSPNVALPAVGLVHFDPEDGRYHVTRARAYPSPIVTGPPASDPAPAPAPTPSGGGALRTLIAAAVVVLGVVAMAVVRHRRRRRRVAPLPPVAAAADRLRTAAAGGDPELAVPLTDYLSLRLGCLPGAVVSPDLAARLQAAGVDRDLAARTARTVEALVAARYGGVSRPAPDDVLGLLAALEADRARPR